MVKKFFTYVLLTGLVVLTSKAQEHNSTQALVNVTERLSLANKNDSVESHIDNEWGEDWGDDWQEEEEKNWHLSGFSELSFGQFTQDNVLDDEQSLAEFRTRFDFNYSHEHIEIVASGDALFDTALDENAWQTRELYLSVSPFRMLDLKIGRQVMTWGTGDYLFLNDLFPKDWQSFFSGRDDEYLKAPSDSVRATTYLGEFSIDTAWTPKFTADNYIEGERFSFYSPLPEYQENIAPEYFPVDTTENDQFSVRIATTQSGVEYALYGYKGYFTNPVGVHVTGEHRGKAYFPKMNAYGGSIRLPVAKGIMNIETAIYNSLEDSKGDKANIPNDQVKLLIGYEQELITNVTGAMQYYLEHLQHYALYERSANFPQQKREQNRHVVTGRLTHMTFNQKLISTVFFFYSPNEHDGYFKPMISYRKNDAWNYSVGANLFWGRKDYTFFGQHQENSNLWARIRFNY